MEAPRLRRDHGGLRSVFDEAMLTVNDDVLRLGGRSSSPRSSEPAARSSIATCPSPTGCAGTTPR